MHKLKKLFLEELKRYENEDEVTPEMLETVHLLTDTVKNICKIDKLMLEDEEGGYSERRGYSRDGEWEARGGYGRNSYDDGGSSYRRRRDRMGRYSRGEGGYSEEGGYSRGEGKEGMVEYLEEMMMDAKSPKEKEAIRKCINEIRGA